MRSLTAIFLSLSLLASTTGLSVLKHYCGGELAATKVMTTHHTSDKPCQEHNHQSDCHHCQNQEKQGCHNSSNHNKDHAKSHNCCDNKVQQFKVEDQFVFSSSNFRVILNAITIQPIVFEAFQALTHTHTFNLKQYLRAQLPQTYRAPELSVLIQSFLI